MLHKIINNFSIKVRREVVAVCLLVITSITYGQVVILERSTWRGKTSSGTEYQFEFMPNGILKYSNWNGQTVATFDNARWQLNSNQLSIDFNNGFANWQGVVTGDNASGTANNKKGNTWTWDFKKINVALEQPFEQLVKKTPPNPTPTSAQGSTNVAQPVPTQPQLATQTQNTNLVSDQNTFKFIPKISPAHINNSLIKEGMTKNDIELFLIIYSFIWHTNNWVNQSPNDNYGGGNQLFGWKDVQSQRHKEFSQFKPKIQQAMNALEETINVMSSNTGLTKIQFKEAIGIIETDVSSDQGRPLYRTLKSKKSGYGYITKIEELNRDDITSNGIGSGIKEFFTYTYKPGSDLSINTKEGHPYTEMSPTVFFDYYTKWIPSYYLHKNRLANLKTTAINLDNELDKNSQNAEKAQAKRIEDEKKRQEFLNSPEGKRQIAKEQADEKQRQIQYAKEFPFYAEITCNNGGYGYFPIYACFSKNNNILFEIRNGPEYKFYTLLDIMQFSGNSARNQNSAGIIDLRNAFQIKIQNGGEDWILGLRVIKRQSNEVVFEKKVSGYGVITLKN